jgi:ABC-2 type transport system ATP-binding protein
MINLEKVTKEFRGFRSHSPVVALDGVSLEVRQGTLLALLGRNGAGKTTLIKIIAGLIIPTSGRVSVAGYDVVKQRQKAIANIGAVFEGNRNIYWYMSPVENLNYFANLRGIASKTAKSRIEDLIAFFNLESKANEPVKLLSRGMQQKVALAIALVTDPKVLLLDEPTLGLDIESYFALKEKIRDLSVARRKTILLATHQMNLVDDISEEIAIINDGRVVVRERTEALKRSFEVNRYVIQARGKVNYQRLKGLERFGCVSTSNNKAVATIDLTLDNSHDLFDTLALLKDMDIHILSINKDEPDLEDIFLRLINNSDKSL